MMFDNLRVFAQKRFYDDRGYFEELFNARLMGHLVLKFMYNNGSPRPTNWIAGRNCMAIKVDLFRIFA
jgi:dTDP-4-dehydrorhamnose 3,5-epimerase-like enzyme